MKKQHPLVVRTPEKINQEYSDIILKLGSFTIELNAIRKQEMRSHTRVEEIHKSKEEFLKRIDELSIEMDEAQKEIKRKESEKAEKITSGSAIELEKEATV